MRFKILTEPEAKQDIQDAINYYNKAKKGLGAKFYKQVKEYFNHLKRNPYHQIRYDNVRCLPMKKYPYMIHFTIDENKNTVIVRAVFQTHQNPNKYPK